MIKHCELQIMIKFKNIYFYIKRQAKVIISDKTKTNKKIPAQTELFLFGKSSSDCLFSINSLVLASFCKLFGMLILKFCFVFNGSFHIAMFTRLYLFQKKSTNSYVFLCIFNSTMKNVNYI